MTKSIISVMSLIFSMGMTLSVNAQINDPAPYCGSEFVNQYNMFRSVKVNTGAAVELGAMGSFGQASGYKYYNTTMLPNMTIGQNNTIEIKSYSVQDGEPLYFAVYIDVNKNNTFEANEVFMQNNNTINTTLNTFNDGDQTITKTFVLPATATAGKTRMRVMRGTEVGNFQGTYNPNFTVPACNVAGDNSYGITYDFDVTLVKAGTTGINEATSSNNVVKVYPNPVSDYLNINVIDSKIGSVNIIGLDGKAGAVDFKNNRVDVSHLSSGIYFLQIRLTEGNMVMGRFVKN